jgi:hypothetical protein
LLIDLAKNVVLTMNRKVLSIQGIKPASKKTKIFGKLVIFAMRFLKESKDEAKQLEFIKSLGSDYLNHKKEEFRTNKTKCDFLAMKYGKDDIANILKQGTRH